MTNHNTNALGACAHLAVTPEEDLLFAELAKPAFSAATNPSSTTSLADSGMTYEQHRQNVNRIQGGNSHSPTPYRPPTR